MPGAAGATAIERWALPEVEGNVIGRPVDEKKAKAAAEAIARVQREPYQAAPPPIRPPAHERMIPESTDPGGQPRLRESLLVEHAARASD